MTIINPYQKIKVLLDEEGTEIARKFHDEVFEFAPECSKLDIYKFESQLDKDGYYHTNLNSFYLLMSDYAKRWLKLPIKSDIIMVE